MADDKLVGKDYAPPSLIAKVTGKAKYSEDFRIEGMLFARLLLSPMPHARVKRIDTSAALAMPGVKAILTPDEIPGPADQMNDLGQTIKANTKGEPALAIEPVYAGEPVLAVAAVDELTATEAIERIVVEWEPLPFNIDPLNSLRPDTPTARLEGNAWMVAAAKPGAPRPAADIDTFKWTDEDFARAGEGQLPTGKANLDWSYGDVEAAFKNSALVLDETFVTPNTNNEALEPRSALAYWQNGQLFLHCSTQSTAQTVTGVARWMHLDPKDVVIIAPYCGGGFGSKVLGAIQSVIPALLAKKANAPVMLRISRREEHFIGGARTGFLGRIRAGFASDGRMTALDLFAVGENGPYEQQYDTLQAGNTASLLYQPPAMRYRSVAVLTNTPPRRPQSGPGGVQPIMLIEPMLAKAARKLGVDQVAIRRINAPSGKAVFGPPNAQGRREHTTSGFLKEALDRGAELFKWEERKARNAQQSGVKVRGVGVGVSTFIAGSAGYDGLLMIRPDGRLAVHTGIGNLGTDSYSDAHRVIADMLGVPWEKVDVVFGDTSKHLPWSAVQGGSSTIYAHTRAAHAAATDAIRKLQEIAAAVHGGKPENYAVQKERVSGPGGSLTLAQAAAKAIELGGKFDGHESPQDVNAFTKRSVAALAGQGLIGVANDKYPRDGSPYSFIAGFAEVEVDRETGKYHVLDYLAVGDVGTVIRPRSLGGQLMGRGLMGIGHAMTQKWVYDAHYGLPLATRFYQTKPLTILDIPAKMAWEAVNIPDPETPVGARGVGEPPVAAGACAVLNALSDALGDDVFRRAPVYLDTILMALEHGRPMQDPLTSHI